MAGRPAKLQLDIVTDANTRGIDQTTSKLSRFGSTVGKVGKAAALGLGAVGIAAGVAAVKLTSMAAEDAKSSARLAQSLRNTTGATRKQIGAVEDWITAQGKQLGVADDELRPALQRLVTATGDVGKAQKLTSLAMNVSAGTGKSLEAVTRALANAQNGSTAGLAKLGAQTKNAAGEALTFDQITKQLAETHRGQAATAANTAAGKYGRLKLQLGEMGETIGGKLLPFANRLAAWALDMVPRVQKLAGQLGDRLGPVLSRVGAFITDRVVPAARQLYTWFVEKIAPGISKTLTPIIDGAKRAFGRITGSVDGNSDSLQKLGRFVGKVVEAFANDFMPVVGKVVGKGFEVIGTAVGVLIDSLGWLIDKISAVIDWFEKLKDKSDFVKGLGAGLSAATGGALGAVGNLTTVGPQLVGQSPSLDGRRGITRGAAQLDAGWGALAAAASSGRLGGPAVIDARTFLSVQVDGSGIVDEVRVAQQLAGVLNRHAQRLGLTPARPF